MLTRSLVDDLRDRIYVLACAVEDVERDLAGRPSAADYREALDWLLDAARPVVEGLASEGPEPD